MAKRLVIPRFRGVSDKESGEMYRDMPPLANGRAPPTSPCEPGNQFVAPPYRLCFWAQNTGEDACATKNSQAQWPSLKVRRRLVAHAAPVHHADEKGVAEHHGGAVGAEQGGVEVDDAGAGGGGVGGVGLRDRPAQRAEVIAGAGGHVGGAVHGVGAQQHPPLQRLLPPGRAARPGRLRASRTGSCAGWPAVAAVRPGGEAHESPVFHIVSLPGPGCPTR